MGKFIDLTGQQFGEWLVVERAANNVSGKPAWVCLCRCGNSSVVAGSVLRMGESRSCGCYQKTLAAKNLRQAATKHGMHNTPEYFRWLGIKLRCYHATHFAYPRYGGRGIGMCDRWRNSFELFHADIGSPPSPSHSLDRIDNNGDYEPNNVRWATKREQANNRRNTVSATFNGETHTQAEWGRKLGLTTQAIAWRMKHGKDLC